MNGHEIDETIWGASVPGSGPFGLPEALGYWFEVDIPGVLAGFRQYSDGRHPNFALFQVWDSSDVLIAQMARTAYQSALTPAGGAGWRNTWLKPRAQLMAATPYLVVMICSEFWSNFGAVASAPFVSGHFTVLQHGTSPNPGNGVYDAATDASGTFNFLNPPHDPTVGHMYGVDVLVRF